MPQLLHNLDSELEKSRFQPRRGREAKGLIVTTDSSDSVHSDLWRPDSGDPVGNSGSVLPIDRILLPVDFTEPSIAAARHAVTLAEKFGSQITLLHVARPGTGHLADPEGALAFDQRRVQRTVAEVLQTVPSKTLFLVGDPAKRIAEHARQESVSLILIPTRGRRRWSGLPTDSVAARVMRRARCPVWTSVEGARDSSRLRNVLCALALAPRSANVLRWASQFADRFEARLTIVHASAGFAEAPNASYFAQLSDARKAWARQDITALQSATGTRADVWLETGDPERTVAAVARRIRADLVVIGRSPAFWRLGWPWSTSYDIVCEAPCPVAIC